MGLARRQPSCSGHGQRAGSLSKRIADTRPGHIPTPPRPRPDRARPALPQELAATFWGSRGSLTYAANMWDHDGTAQSGRFDIAFRADGSSVAALSLALETAIGPIAKSRQCGCGKPLAEPAFELNEHPDKRHRQRKNRGDKQKREMGNVECHGHRSDLARRVPEDRTSDETSYASAPAQLCWSQ